MGWDSWNEWIEAATGWDRMGWGAMEDNFRLRAKRLKNDGRNERAWKDVIKCSGHTENN